MLAHLCDRNNINSLKIFTTMAKFNVVFKESGSTSTCRSAYTVDAASEYEAVEKWKQTIAGKNGRCEVVEVYKTGSR